MSRDDKYTSGPLPKPLLLGRREEALYRDTGVALYRGNPLIEALPPILDPAGAKNVIERLPAYDPLARIKPAHLRRQELLALRLVHKALPCHLELEAAISADLRAGYISRNPVTSPSLVFSLARSAQPFAETVERGLNLSNPFTGTTCLIGPAGSGKSTSVVNTLLSYPQVIDHKAYTDGTKLGIQQIVWLKLDVPHDGSIRGTCLSLCMIVDQILGTRYLRRALTLRAANAMLPLIAQMCAAHLIGIIVVDEVQNINVARSGGQNQMRSFFMALQNVLGVQTMLVGTEQAVSSISENLMLARRTTGSQGQIKWNRMANDRDFAILVKGFWEYQYTSKPTPLTAELVRVLHFLSAGIPDLAIKIYSLAQSRAIGNREIANEQISIRLLQSVTADRLPIANRLLNKLRGGDPFALRQLDAEDTQKQLQKEYERAVQAEGERNNTAAGQSLADLCDDRPNPAPDQGFKLPDLVEEARTLSSTVHDLLVSRGLIWIPPAYATGCRSS